MRKAFILIVFLFVIIIVDNVSAVDIEFFKESKNFSQGETIIFKISGNFIDQITRDNVIFYKDSIRTPFEFEIVKVENDFYVYALTSLKNQGNYSFEIRDVRYYKGLAITDEKIKDNFTINSELADFFVEPGAIKSDKNFVVKVTNIQDKKIDIEIKKPKEISLEGKTKISLNSGMTSEINFIPSENAQGPYFIEFKSSLTSYKIPVFITKQNKTLEESQKFEFQPKEINILIPTNTTSKRIIYIVNLGKKIDEINFSIFGNASSFLKLNPEKITDLEENETKKIEIFIDSDNEEKNLSAVIIASSSLYNYQTKVLLTFIKDYIPTEEENTSKIVSCKELKGEVCKDGFKCSGEVTYVKDGACCLPPAICKKIEEKSNKGKIIGWIILILIMLLLVLFYKKYKDVKR